MTLPEYMHIQIYIFTYMHIQVYIFTYMLLLLQEPPPMIHISGIHAY